jgi:hypothetical protein
MTANTTDLSFFQQAVASVSWFNVMISGCIGGNATWHEY